MSAVDEEKKKGRKNALSVEDLEKMVEKDNKQVKQRKKSVAVHRRKSVAVPPPSNLLIVPEDGGDGGGGGGGDVAGPPPEDKPPVVEERNARRRRKSVAPPPSFRRGKGFDVFSLTFKEPVKIYRVLRPGFGENLSEKKSLRPPFLA